MNVAPRRSAPVMYAPSRRARVKSARRAVVQFAGHPVFRHHEQGRVRALQPAAAQVGPHQRGPAQVAARQVRLMQVRPVELRETQIAISQRKAGLARRLVTIHDQIRIGHHEVALEQPEQRTIRTERQKRNGVSGHIARRMPGSRPRC